MPQFWEKHPEVIKNPFYILAPEGSQKRNNHTFRTYNAETVQYRTEILLFMGPKIWSLFPSNINNSEALEIFKQK